MNLDRICATCHPYLLSLFRFVTGLLFLHYGVAKIFKFPPLDVFEDVTPLSLWGAAGMLEILLGTLLMLGLFTRAGRLHPVGRNGFRLFHRALSAQLLSAGQ